MLNPFAHPASKALPKLRERKERLQKSSQVFIEHVLVIAWIQFERMHEIMPRARRNLTGFFELYTKGHLILKRFSSFLSTISFLKHQNTEKT